MKIKTCDRCGEIINPPHLRTQATTMVRVIVSDPQYLTQYAMDLCYDCQREVFFCAKPTGKWFNGMDHVRQGEKK